MTASPRPSRPTLVLIVDDQEWSARALESILSPNGYAVLRAYTGRQALELAATVHPDAVIIDVTLPDLDGITVCEMLRNGILGAHTPIVVTTSGPCERAMALSAYRAGAWEFCSQPLDGESFLSKLATFVRSKREVDRVHDDALVDPVTGLYNLRGLARRAHEIGAEALRNRKALACVALSAEGTPSDGSPPPTGLAGEVAVHLEKVFRSVGRASDARGRVGVAEFGIIAPSTEASGAVRLVQRVQERLDSESLTFCGTPCTLTVRAGYYAVSDFAESPVDAIEMLLRATNALRRNRDERRVPLISAFDDRPLRVLS